jgi:hypothetical protein
MRGNNQQLMTGCLSFKYLRHFYRRPAASHKEKAQCMWQTIKDLFDGNDDAAAYNNL